MDSFSYVTNTYSTVQNKLMKTFRALSSGSSISSAADNPAGLSQSSSYSVQISGTARSMNNIQDSLSMLNTADGGIDPIAQNLQSINVLTVQAGNGSLSSSDLHAIQSQINQLSQSIDSVASSTQFNGKNLLDGSVNLTLQTGANSGQTENISLPNMSSSALGISGIDVTTAAGQAAALSSVSAAIQQVGDQSAAIGSMDAGLKAALNSQSTAYINVSAAKSRVSDTDYAASSSDLASGNAQSQSALKAISMYNKMQNMIVGLLPK